MRLWTIHPKYLDAQGLVALWREALLARAVLKGETRGYTNHPQLIRFRNQKSPLRYINAYLRGVYEEAIHRGYSFDAKKLSRVRTPEAIAETRGQLAYEWEHLKSKLAGRSPKHFEAIKSVRLPEHHPMFTIVEGPVREWERVKTR